VTSSHPWQARAGRRTACRSRMRRRPSSPRSAPSASTSGTGRTTRPWPTPSPRPIPRPSSSRAARRSRSPTGCRWRLRRRRGWRLGRRGCLGDRRGRGCRGRRARRGGRRHVLPLEARRGLRRRRGRRRRGERTRGPLRLQLRRLVHRPGRRVLGGRLGSGVARDGRRGGRRGRGRRRRRLARLLPRDLPDLGRALVHVERRDADQDDRGRLERQLHPQRAEQGVRNAPRPRRAVCRLHHPVDESGRRVNGR